MAEEYNSPRSSVETRGAMDPDTFSNNQEGAESSSDDASDELVPEALKFNTENGRTYHGYKAGTYNFPNDHEEQDRLDHQGVIFNFVLDGARHLAPLDEDLPLKVIDIGTGTGQWAIDMGDRYPNFDIQGTDLSPIQSTLVPPNVSFFVDDASNENWAVDPNYFDYVHTRAMLGSFSSFANVIKRGFFYTKPGGYMESQDFLFTPSCDDGSMPPDWPFLEWTNYSVNASNLAGRPLRIGHKLKRWYEEAGFVDVRQEIFKMPMNPWARDADMKELGRLSEKNWLQGLGAFTMAPFSRMLDWSKDEIEVYLVNIRKCITDRNVHAYHKIYVVWGRKPLPGEVIKPPPPSSHPDDEYDSESEKDREREEEEERRKRKQREREKGKEKQREGESQSQASSSRQAAGSR